MDQLKHAVSDAHFLLVRRYYRITREVIENGKKLRLIQRAGADYSNIDTEAAREAGIFVATMPMAIDASVAELTMLFILAHSKKLFKSHANCVDGEYKRLNLEPIETSEYQIASNWMRTSIDQLFHKTLGIIGFGEIGRLVATRAKSFGMKILYNKRIRLDQNLEKELGVQYSDLDTLLQESDFVTLHVPLTGETRKMIGEKEFSMMKRTAVIINTSRGGVVDEIALCEALKKRQISGAGLDVFLEEPIPEHHPLLTMSNVILTPHIAGGTQETLKHDIRRLRGNIDKVLGGERPCNVVNGL
jgi:phosphoglycerate dehydrogenase-like enzyme